MDSGGERRSPRDARRAEPSLALLDRSLDALGPGRTGDDPSWAEYWNRSKVLGYMGACHMRMRRPEAARAALDDALHLGEELKSFAE
jgi:hypothetical protein